MKGFYLLFKRLLDVIVCLSVIILLLPFFLAIAVLIKIDSRGPLFFTQQRVGKGLSTFKVLKFRTMTNEKRVVGDKPVIGKDVGVTAVGYYLRRFKIDEMPQLINVLKGEMTIVGPRPSVPQQLVKMTEEEKRRYSVVPGLTGVSQVSGNIHISWKERYAKDLQYVDNMGLRNDLRIILRTFYLLIRGEEYFKNKPFRLIVRK